MRSTGWRDVSSLLESVMDHNRVLQVIDELYSTTMSPERWGSALEGVAQAMGATCTIISRFDFSSGTDRVLASTGMDKESARLYQRRFGPMNIHLLRGGSLLKEGRALLGTQVCPEAELLASDYYNQFMAPNDWFYWISVAVLCDATGCVMVSSYRRLASGNFGADDCELLETLAPHLKNSLAINRQMREVTELNSALQNALNLATNAIIIADENAKPKFMNLAARQLTDNGDGIECNGVGIKVSNRELQERLHESIRRTISATHFRPPESIFVRRSSRKRDLVVLVARCNPTSRMGTGNNYAMLVIIDRELNPPSRAEVASQVFGLSSAETRLLNGITSGSSIEELSAEFRLSQNTLRSQLKAVFHKTGTNRQSELVRLISAFPSFESEDDMSKTEAA